MSTIYEAIVSGKIDAVKSALVDDAANINRAAPNGEYPLHAAVKAKSVKMVEMLIAAGANVNQASEETGSMRGYTAAHYAARNGDVDVILVLAKAKADFRREAHDHWQPIHCATFSGKRNAMIALLDNGADIHAKNQHGHTALVYAVNHGRTSDVRELLSRGATLTISDPNGDSMLHHCFHYQMSKLFEGEYDVPEVQLDVAVVIAIAGCPVDAKNNEGNTADFYLKDDVPAFSSVLKIISHNVEQFRASKTEWNYMTLLTAKPEHFMGMGMDMKHAMDLFENMKKTEKERQDAKKRREEERPEGGCPVMKGKKKKAGADAAPSGHPDVDVSKVDPNGPDPSGGQCPFFKKKAPAAPEIAVLPTPPAVVQPVAARESSAPFKPPQLDSYTASLAGPPLQKPAAAGPVFVGSPFTWEFLFEHRTTVMMMLICFFCGMIFEQWSARLFGRRY